MATRFAVKTGVWSDTTTWDSGALPVAGDVIYPNGFTVTIDTDINVASLNNNASNVNIPNIATPAMTSNTQPSGTVFAGQNPTTAFQAFDQNTATSWTSNNFTNCTVGYQFTSGKVIRRYYLDRANENGRPNTWVFQGSLDGITYDTLDSVSANTGTTGYLSPLLTNSTAYVYYRINITAAVNVGYAIVRGLEMTESTATSYGGTTGGSFTVPASLSGTRNIVQSGAGIISNNSASVITTAHTSGNTVNFNVQSGGYIFNPSSQTATASFKILAINGTGAVNFNSDIYGCQTNEIENQQGLINISANSTVTVNGNVYLGKARTSFPYYTITIPTSFNSAILNINGNIFGSNYSTQSSIYINSLSTVNLTGNLTSDIGPCIITGVGASVNLTGTATVTNANSSPAISLNSASLLTINGSITNKNNVNAILASKIRFASTATPYWVYQTNGASDMTLAYGAATGPYPVEADVRFGTTYAASPTRTGTLRVPLPQYVSQGVLTDNTTGTAYLSATDVWNVLTSNITTAGSIGERLKNASTVQTNGDQLAAYIV